MKCTVPRPQGCMVASCTQCTTRMHHALGCCFGRTGIGEGTKCWGGLGCRVKKSLTASDTAPYSEGASHSCSCLAPCMAAEWPTCVWVCAQLIVCVWSMPYLCVHGGQLSTPVDFGTCCHTHSLYSFLPPLANQQHHPHSW